jgi:cupin superfamily acireductone dioxygenase involved in methionine salvage
MTWMNTTLSKEQIMNNKQVNQVASTMGNIAKKIAESATHAAVFAFVSKKVTDLMKKHEAKDTDKVRIEESSPKLDGTNV